MEINVNAITYLIALNICEYVFQQVQIQNENVQFFISAQ